VRKLYLLTLAAELLLAACVTVPTGPNVMVLPGYGKGFEQFQGDDAVCRQWAAQQSGAVTSQAATNTTATGAAIGTALGAASGAAIGAAAGNPAAGAAAGAGIGLVGGTAAGANQAAGAQWTVQQRYDIAYMQCMYAKGNQIPIPGGSELAHAPAAQEPPPPPPPDAPLRVPPPPRGSPPPPPPGASR
jgi:hypothetical protein